MCFFLERTALHYRYAMCLSLRVTYTLQALPQRPGIQEMSKESEALIAAAAEMMYAVEYIKDARKALADLPAARDESEADAKDRLRVALAETHLSMLLAPLTMCAVAKKLAVIPHH